MHMQSIIRPSSAAWLDYPEVRLILAIFAMAYLNAGTWLALL